MTRAVLATASARSAARPSQNMASAARVGTDDTRSTCGSGATTGGAARSAPSTHTSLARRAVGRRGSSPSARTRPLPPAITVMPSGPATACSRITTSGGADPALAERRHGGQRGARLEDRQVEAMPVEPLDGGRPERREQRVLEHPASVGVGQDDAALGGREQQAGHARSCSWRSPRSGPPPHPPGDGRRRRWDRARRACAATPVPCARRGRAPRRGGSRAGGPATSAPRRPARRCRR